MSDPPSTTRRAFLAGLGAAGAVSAAGCLGGRTRPYRATDWPMLGYRADGCFNNPDASPPTDGVAVAWRGDIDFTRLPPLAHDGEVYVTDSEQIVVFDARDGRRRRTIDRRVGAPVAIAPARAYSTPTILVPTSAGVAGLNAGGTPIEQVPPVRFSVGRRQDSLLSLGGVAGPAPVVHDGSAYLADGRRPGLVKLSPGDGAVEWIAETAEEPRRPAVSDGVAVITDWAGGCYGVDAATGERLWHHQYESLRGQPAIHDGTAYLLSHAGFDAYDLRSGDRRRRHEWTRAVEGHVAVGGEFLFAVCERADGADELVAIDREAGTVAWAREAAASGEDWFGPIVAGDALLHVDDGVVARDVETGAERWRFDGAILSPPIAVGDRVYVAADRTLYALEEP